MTIVITTMLLAFNLTGDIQEKVEEIHKINKVKYIKEEVMNSTSIYDENIPLDRDLQKYIHNLSEEYNISKSLFYAVVAIESNFDPNAISPTNDLGLLQLNVNSGTLGWLAAEIGLGDNFEWNNPYHSAKAGFWYLSWLRDYWKDKGFSNEEDLFNLITSSYNQGYPTVLKRVRKGGSLSSRYSERVLDVKSEIEQGAFQH